MPSKTKAAGKKPRGRPKTAVKSVKKDTGTTKTSRQSAKRKDEAAEQARHTVAGQVVPYVLLCLAVFVAFCFLFSDTVGFVGQGISEISFGLFGRGAIALPFLIANLALMWRRDFEKRMVRYKLVFSFVCLLFISALVHAFSAVGAQDTLDARVLWEAGIALSGGGAAGGFLGTLMLRGVGTAGTLIISISVFLSFGLFIFGLTPHAIFVYVAYHLQKWREEKALEAEQGGRSGKYHITNIKHVADRTRIPDGTENAVEAGSDAMGSRAAGSSASNSAAADYAAVNSAAPDSAAGFNAASSNAEGASGKGGAGGGKLTDTPAIDMAVFDEVLKQTRNKADDDSPPFSVSDAPGNDTGNSGGGKTEQGGASGHAVRRPAVFGVRSSAKRPNGADEAVTDLKTVFSGEDEPVISPEILNRLSADNKGDAPDTAAVDLNVNGGAPKPGGGFGVERHRLIPNSSDAQDAAEPKKREYVLPPAQLLKIENQPKNSDISEELQTTAKKLVDTLTSFKVRTRIVNVSRGPTITRYELAPDEGVRVRAISNLVDDIALSLATIGVRIEAPIPGKSAVGIEVPNRVVALVYLRELIENPRFRQSSSKINVSLGMDVAGEPVYVDIFKMPHLLIAGATGMGKSVCINSMIVSLLYKATPDEVKLILVDPKKVELNIYNGLPHLLVPVVSDPKKAAGSLHWAVTEMERRFELIESAGVRDIKSYNAAVEGDPEHEKLPQIVIIIDELADLMMTAPDDVEESICRLAQKARAAGMHLIIGTQRPSVDVITGLIKANIPSRIAFTVASQVDSRTIIDITGAEKLIGRGDMLYAPVGSAKPVRVQGAYVSESEIEAVTAFIRRQTGEAGYDEAVIADIERAAENCIGTKKNAMSGKIDDDGDENDPMLKPALELAVESGKISTSLIQRRLSLGYGRAAKLIDRMEQLGFVSPPEGQKPRNVLITRQQYMEMIVNKDDIG